MYVLRVISVIICYAGARSSAIDSKLSVTNDIINKNTTDISPEEALRIEMVKMQILSQVNMKNPPPPVEAPSESMKEAVDILLQETEQQESVIPPADRLAIRAQNGGIMCSLYDSSSCRTFQFNLTADLNSSSVALWIYIKKESSSKILSISVSYSAKLNKQMNKKYFWKLKRTGWNRVDMPPISISQALDSCFQCTVELFGPIVEDTGERRPFLLVSKPPKLDTRRRRDAECDSRESCCWKSLSVSLSEIGFTWIVYPVYLEVNMCTGKCRMDLNEMKTHYERAMTKILENDSNLHNHLGMCWTLCCKPKQMDPVRIIYRDLDGILHDQHIPELMVKSCSCS